MRKIREPRDQKTRRITSPLALSSKRMKRLRKFRWGRSRNYRTRRITSPPTLSSKKVNKLRNVGWGRSRNQGTERSNRHPWAVKENRLRKVLDQVRMVVLISIWAIQNLANKWKHRVIKGDRSIWMVVLISIWAIQNLANKWKHRVIKGDWSILVPYVCMDQLSNLWELYLDRLLN